MNLSLFAQAAQSTCTLNGQPIDCGELAEKAKPFIGLGIGIFLIIMVIVIITFVFWLLMLIHAIKYNSPDKNTWIIVLVVSFVIGFGFVAALVYFFAERKKAELYPSPAPKQTTGPSKRQKG